MGPCTKQLISASQDKGGRKVNLMQPSVSFPCKQLTLFRHSRHSMQATSLPAHLC